MKLLRQWKNARSIRKFKPDMPAKKDLEQIIEAGLYAAKWHRENRQPSQLR
ncbi:MAG: nitroreductase family protein [Clostridium sp.]